MFVRPKIKAVYTLNTDDERDLLYRYTRSVASIKTTTDLAIHNLIGVKSHAVLPLS